MIDKRYAQKIFRRLVKQFPDAHCELIHDGPFQLLIATILSAQCTDKQVNKVTPGLFKKYPNPKKLSSATIDQIEQTIRSIGLYKNKAKNIHKCAQQLLDDHQGEVPQDMDALVSLAGVGRKTANVVLGNAFNINHGVVVDTHVKRISNLLKLTEEDNPVKIEQDLMKLFKRDDWTLLSHLFIFLGRSHCKARNPICDNCGLNKICPSSTV